MKRPIVRLDWENTMRCAHLLNAKCMLALSNVAVQIRFLRQIVRRVSPFVEFAPSVAVESYGNRTRYGAWYTAGTPAHAHNPVSHPLRTRSGAGRLPRTVPGLALRSAVTLSTRTRCGEGGPRERLRVQVIVYGGEFTFYCSVASARHRSHHVTSTSFEISTTRVRSKTKPLSTR